MPFAFLIWVSSHPAAIAQQSGEGIVSPEVSADHRVTIRFRAPDAKKVLVLMDGYRKPLGMTRDSSGVWTVTTDPLVPDFYGYWIVKDKSLLVSANNPMAAPILLIPGNSVHVPGPSSLPWEINDVPRGEVHHQFYHSKLAGDDRDLYVYTPPGYEASAEQGYPVLYLLHGLGDDASAWISIGRANIILDNLIARGKAKPMIVVMPLCYGERANIAQAGYVKRARGLTPENYEKFRRALVQEVMPMVEGAYRVKSDRESRAIAGLSMGGFETLFIGLNNLDRFAYLGAFSSVGVTERYAATFPTLDSSASAKLRLFWMSCGRDDFLLKENERLRDWLAAKGIHVLWVESSGAHWWPIWRRNLSDLLPQLFQEKSVPSDYWTQQVQPQR